MAIGHEVDEGDDALVELGVGQGGKVRGGGEIGESGGDVEFVAGELEEAVRGDVCVDVVGDGDDLETGGEGECGLVGLLEECGAVEQGDNGGLLTGEERGLVRMGLLVVVVVVLVLSLCVVWIGGREIGVGEVQTKGRREAKVDGSEVSVVTVSVQCAGGDD